MINYYAINVSRKSKGTSSHSTGRLRTVQPMMPFDIFYRDFVYFGLSGETGDEEKVTKVFDFEDDGETASLIHSHLIAEHLSLEDIKFKTEEIVKISYNRTTKEYKGNVEDIEIYKHTDLVSLQNIFKYIDVVASVNNKIHEVIADVSRKKLKNSSFFYYNSNGNIILKNILCMLQESILEVEKLINSGNSRVLTKNLSTEGFRLTPAKKLGKTIGLPQFALPLIKKIRIESCIDSLNKLCELVDGNDLRILLELFENSRNFLIIRKVAANANLREVRIGEFIDSLTFLMSEERVNKYNLQDVLNYVLRQSMFWGLSDEFSFPFEEMNLFVDYVNICEQNNLTHEKYPQNIRRMHDIVLINVSTFDNVDDAEFQKAVSGYKMYEMDLKDGYSFIVPKDTYDLVQEGNDLHHCIGSYADKIARGKSKIMFMRKTTEKEKPFVTVEFDNNCNIVEIKGIYNEEPEKDIITIANKWAGICKRLSGK